MTDTPRASRAHLLFAIAGTLLFGAALLLGARLFLVTLGTDPGQGSAVRGALANTLLFTAFAAHHSLMARSGLKQRLVRVWPVHLERALYVWISSLLFLGMCLMWLPVPGLVWQAEGWWRLAGWAVQGVGLAVTLAGAVLLDPGDLAGVDQVLKARRGARLAPHTATGTMTRRGPYGLVRHPIYLGWLLMTLAAPNMTAGRLVFALVSGVYLLLAIPWEERSLVHEHGDAYREYQRDVRWRAVPGLY